MTNYKKLVVLIAGVVVLVVLGAGIGVIYRLEFMPWYSVTIEPFDGRTLVRFAQPRMRLVSPDFFVEGTPSAPGTYEIDPAGLNIAGCTSEFSDHAPLGGRHKIRIGGVLFDVMEVRVVVNGKDYDWRRSPN